EVVTEAVRARTMTAVDGVWRWQGELRVGARLQELVDTRLAVLDEDERAVVALLAGGDRGDKKGGEAAGVPRAGGSLLKRGFVADEHTGAHGGTVLKLDHPLFAEAVRSAMSATERARWCRFLAETLPPGAPAGDTDLALLQRALWLLDGGIATDAELL